ncbi:hypothetical protein [Sandarakinorhabdus oryzae]|uniref:hypothetical protein n=1 Tax=Sandarakinorhabdus oryzae TaxID=2675220 RepID=UPI0012E16788|nr:hypothetical protein [Sandarakinorhabdus oryzae]
MTVQQTDFEAGIGRRLASPRTVKTDTVWTEHLFFTGYMMAALLVIFVGFAPSFYLRGLVPSAAPLAPLRIDTIVHGVLASLFMLAFPLQAMLAATGRIRAHVALGKWAFACGAALVPMAYVVGAQAYHAIRPVPFPREMLEGLVALPLFGSLALGLTLWLAWRRRFDGPAHKRLMVALACQLADPAIFRLPISPLDPMGLLVIQAIMLATLAPLWIWDVATRGRIHRWTLIGSLIFMGEVVARTLVMPASAWATLVHALPLYGQP